MRIDRNGEVKWGRSYGFGRWLVLSQDGMSMMRKLGLNALRLLLWLFSKCEYRNRVEVSEVPGMSRQAVWRALKELEMASIVVRFRGGVFLNPTIAWKGNPKSHYEGLNEYAGHASIGSEPSCDIDGGGASDEGRGGGGGSGQGADGQDMPQHG